MADQKDNIGTRVAQLLQVVPDDYTSTLAEKREQADYRQLEDLSVTTTSGDTLVIVKFPPGNFVNCHGWKVFIHLLILHFPHSLSRPFRTLPWLVFGNLVIYLCSGKRKSS
jgi:hypothetical protein